MPYQCLLCKVVSHLKSKRRSFALQKGIFYNAKGALLMCKRCPFTTLIVTLSVCDGYKTEF